jgi:hypothetical protein
MMNFANFRLFSQPDEQVLLQVWNSLNVLPGTAAQ